MGSPCLGIKSLTRLRALKDTAQLAFPPLFASLLLYNCFIPFYQVCLFRIPQKQMLPCNISKQHFAFPKCLQNSSAYMTFLKHSQSNIPLLPQDFQTTLNFIDIYFLVALIFSFKHLCMVSFIFWPHVIFLCQWKNCPFICLWLLKVWPMFSEVFKSSDWLILLYLRA